MLIASQVAPGKPAILHCSDMSDEQRWRQHGRGTHSSIGSLKVGAATTVEFEFEIGEQTVVTGGRLLVVWRWPFDWSDLQTQNPSGPGYLKIEHLPRRQTTAQFSAKYNWIAGIEPWHHQLQVVVEQGQLEEGDRVRLICGDRSQGGAGWHAPTCVARRCRFLMLVNHQGTGQRIRLVPTPSFPLLAERAERLVAVLPSDGEVGRPLHLIVRAEDGWGNPTALDDAAVSLPPGVVAGASGASGESTESAADVQANHRQANHRQASLAASPNSAGHFLLTFTEVGLFQIEVSSAEIDASAISNPIRIHEPGERNGIYWGDLHSGQTEIGCGAGSLAEHYAFGRDCAGLSFITHQANDHYVTQDDWQQTREVTEQFNEPGRYVTLLGCEWSPLTKDGGDRNVFYRHDDPVLRRSDRFFIEQPPDPEPDIPTAPDFHDAFRDREVLVNIHVGGRMTNLDWHEPAIERLCEAHSTHGTVEWFFQEAIERGFRVGLTAGTDGVMGRPGACHPGRRLIRNLPNGLTAVLADQLNRESIWEALQQRRCYATSGERIRLDMRVDGHLMGSEFQARRPVTVQIQVDGTAAIERVDLFENTACIHTWHATQSEVAPNRLRFLWGGTQRRGTARLQQVIWDGTLSVNRGSVQLVRPVGFQAHDDYFRAESSSIIRWSSKTAGNATGMVVDLVGDEHTEIVFDSLVLQERFSLPELLAGERYFDAGGVGRFLRIGPSPDPQGRFDFQAEYVAGASSSTAERVAEISSSAAAETAAYWVRVTQVNQALAWSSPVYVTYLQPSKT